MNRFQWMVGILGFALFAANPALAGEACTIGPGGTQVFASPETASPKKAAPVRVARTNAHLTELKSVCDIALAVTDCHLRQGTGFEIRFQSEVNQYGDRGWAYSYLSSSRHDYANRFFPNEAECHSRRQGVAVKAVDEAQSAIYYRDAVPQTGASVCSFSPDHEELSAGNNTILKIRVAKTPDNLEDLKNVCEIAYAATSCAETVRWMFREYPVLQFQSGYPWGEDGWVKTFAQTNIEKEDGASYWRRSNCELRRSKIALEAADRAQEELL